MEINSRKKTERTKELFERLNLQIAQDKKISQLNKNGYCYLNTISKKLKCPEEVLVMALPIFGEDSYTFNQPNGDFYILLKTDTIQKWYDEENNNAQEKNEDIANYLYNRYIGVNFEGCIPLCAAQDFAEQKEIPQKYFISAFDNKELHITKYKGQEMINENDLIAWIEKRTNNV